MLPLVTGQLAGVDRKMITGVDRKMIRGKFLGGASIMCLVGSVLLSQPLGAGTNASLQTWTCGGLAATIVGTPASETLRGTSGVDVIVAREGNDLILALGGDDIVCAGKGHDTVFGGGGFDILFGAQGNDSLYSSNGASAADRADTRGARMFGGAGDDVIYGSNKWDRMQGGPGKDQLNGYEGRDWLRAGPGNDLVDGGPGIDDLHGGNGRDDIEMTNGDVVRGGAGLDLCRIGAGEPSLFRSCGLGVREAPRVDAVSEVPREDVVVSEDGIDVTDLEPEFTEDSIDLDDAVEELGVETPCDLYSTPELRTAMTAWSQTSGLTADLPNGLLAPGSEIGFDTADQSATACSWFSEAQLWFVEISFQPVSGFTDELQSRGEQVPGLGDSASINDDTSGFLRVGDLFVSITNLPPGHTQTINDRAVLRLMMADVAAKLS